MPRCIYLAHNAAELRTYFDAVPPDRLGWAFTVNHSHLVPEGIDGFLNEFGTERIGEVRLADNTGDYEVHLVPGEGTIDFGSLVSRLESSGYQRHYMMAYGTDETEVCSHGKRWRATLTDTPPTGHVFSNHLKSPVIPVKRDHCETSKMSILRAAKKSRPSKRHAPPLLPRPFGFAQGDTAAPRVTCGRLG